MDVTCDECGAVSSIADPADDGWVLETEPREFMAETTTPAGNVVQFPSVYEHPVRRVIFWKCAEPVHGLEGHTSRYEEELA